MSLDPPLMTYKLKVIIEKPNIVVLASLFYDGKQIPKLGEYENTSGRNGHVIDCPMNLGISNIYIDKDICVDLKAGRCYKLNVSPETLVKNHPDYIESILFLLRRIGYKKAAFDLLKFYLRNSINLSGISYLFKTINRVYKIAALERKESTIEDDKRRSQSFSYSKNNQPRRYSLIQNPEGESEMRMETGMTVLFQGDLMSVVFQPLFLDSSVPPHYLASVLLEYHRSLIDQDLQVHIDLQILLARVLIKSKKLSLLHQLVQFNVFNDTKEFAGVLIALANPGHLNYYPPALQLAVDMLYRMKSYDFLIDLFMDNKMVYEALCLLAAHPYPGLDTRKLLQKTDDLGDVRMTEVVDQFLKDMNL